MSLEKYQDLLSHLLEQQPAPEDKNQLFAQLIARQIQINIAITLQLDRVAMGEKLTEQQQRDLGRLVGTQADEFGEFLAKGADGEALFPG